MKYFPLILLSAIISLFFFGCPGSNPTDNTSNEPSINGTVVDVNNVPVADAEIHYFFGTSYHSPATAIVTNPTPTTRIIFSIPESSKVVINIIQIGTRKHIFTLKDTVYSAGTYSISFDMMMLTNGFYIYQIITDSFVTEKIMIILRYDISELVKTEPLTRTDRGGKFSLPMSLLGVGRYLYTSYDNEPVVVDSVKIDSISIVVHNQGKILIEGFNVNETQSITRTFVLK